MRDSTSALSQGRVQSPAADSQWSVKPAPRCLRRSASHPVILLLANRFRRRPFCLEPPGRRWASGGAAVAAAQCERPLTGADWHRLQSLRTDTCREAGQTDGLCRRWMGGRRHRTAHCGQSASEPCWGVSAAQARIRKSQLQITDENGCCLQTCSGFRLVLGKSQLMDLVVSDSSGAA